MVRHCSVCRSTAHDRRNCPKLAKNPEFYGYPPHPIRHGKGVHRDNGEPYDPRKAKGDKAAAKRARQVAKGSPATRKLHRVAEDDRAVRELVAAAKKHGEGHFAESEERLRSYAGKGEEQHDRSTGLTVRPSAFRRAAEEVAKLRREHEQAERKNAGDTRDSFIRRLRTVKEKQRALYAGTDRMTRSEQARHRSQVGAEYARLKREEAQIEDEARKAGVRF